MCLICVEVMKGRMNIRELKRAVGEIATFDENASDHIKNLEKALKSDDMDEIEGEIVKGTEKYEI